MLGLNEVVIKSFTSTLFVLCLWICEEGWKRGFSRKREREREREG